MKSFVGTSVLLVTLVVSLSAGLIANANEQLVEYRRRSPGAENTVAGGPTSTGTAGTVPDGQRELINAQNSGRGLNFVEVKDVVVTALLPDDTSGREHQKWMVQLANGKELMAVYNLDLNGRIPMKEGDKMSLGGQYIFDRSGGLIHWLHTDPRGRRPAGYVEVSGVRYGK